MQLILDFFQSEIDELNEKNVRVTILGDKAGKVSNGDKIVVLSSAQGDHKPGRTDTIYVHTVGACD